MGFTLFAVTMLGYGLTTAGVNPARTFAPALFGGEWSDIWVFFVGPIVGAIAGWVLYRVIVRGDTDFTDDLLLENNECRGSVDEHGIYVSNSSARVTAGRSSMVRNQRARLG